MSTATNGGWIEQIPQVEIELMSDGNICVTDSSYSEQNFSVVLHPIHLRLIAEKLGLARSLSASEADALRMVDKLARRMGVLHERILQLDKWLWDHPDHEDADITTEIWYSAATTELSNEFQAELVESGAITTPRRTQSVPPENPLGSGTQTQAKPAANPTVTQRVPVKFKGPRSQATQPRLDLGGDHG